MGWLPCNLPSGPWALDGARASRGDRKVAMSCQSGVFAMISIRKSNIVKEVIVLTRRYSGRTCPSTCDSELWVTDLEAYP